MRRRVRSRLSGHSGNGGAGKNREHGLLGLDPDRMRRTARFSRTRTAGNHADIEADGTVDGLNDFKHGCRTAARRNAKAACLTAPRGDEPGVSKGLQDLGEEAFRRARGLGQPGQRDAPIGRRRGQLNHDTDGIVGGASELHRRITSLHLVFLTGNIRTANGLPYELFHRTMYFAPQAAHAQRLPAVAGAARRARPRQMKTAEVAQGACKTPAEAHTILRRNG